MVGPTDSGGVASLPLRWSRGSLRLAGVGHLNRAEQPELSETELSSFDQGRVDSELPLGAVNGDSVPVDGVLQLGQLVTTAARPLQKRQLAGVQLPAITEVGLARRY
jgi:hypothetical protein